MRQQAQRVLSHLAPALWAAATVAVAVLEQSDSWDLADARGLVGIVILLTGAAIGASACRRIEKSIEKTHDGSIRLLVDALRDEMPSREPDERHLHAAG